MKKPQNRFIEEIEKDSAGSFAGSSENRSSGAGVAGKNDSSRKCGARRDSRSANENKLKEGWKSPCLSHFCGIRLSKKRGGCRIFF